MSRKKWDALPAPVRKVLEDNSGEAQSKAFGAFWDRIAEDTKAELRKMPGTKASDARVFCGKNPARAHDWRRLWKKVTAECGLGDRNFHQLRHGCGSMSTTISFPT